MNITLRYAVEDDIPILMGMWQSIDTFPKVLRPFGGDAADKPEHTQRIIKHCIASDYACTLVAETENNKIIGTISGHVFDKPAVVLTKVGVIYSLWVNADHRQKGVGSELLNHLEHTLANLGAQSFQVGWDFKNTLAASWWQAKGYLPYETIASKPV